MPEDQLLAELIALRAEVREIIDRVTSLEKENTTLSENQEIQLKLINQLRAETRKAPQPMQKDRADILRALLVAGGKMLAKDARQKMHIKKNHFAELLRVCDSAETKQFPKIKIDSISYMNSNKDSPFINPKTELNYAKEDSGACGKIH